MASESPADNVRQIFTVTQLNRSARQLLETNLPLMWVEGELSNLTVPSSGHWYFTLKDEGAQVRCAMFRNRNMLVRFKPKSGDKVLLRAKVSLYEGRGDYQLIAEHMEPSGQGDLQLRFQQLKDKLAAEGLFDQVHKKPLPLWPARLGVVTSPTGAAVHDILHVLCRRFPSLPVTVLPVSVQGAKAAGEIAAAIDLANAHRVCDVLIVGRGGGSLEDLWAFNEEVVARAIFASKIPIVSAVGHEIDFTIADFVADLRAPTPSAAAEIASPDAAALLAQFDRLAMRLQQAQTQRLRWAERDLQLVRNRLQHPGQRLQNQAQTLDRLEAQLVRAVTQRLHQSRRLLNAQQGRLTQCSPDRQLHHQEARLNYLSERLRRAALAGQEKRSSNLARTACLLQSVSPLNTLKRGYAIVQKPTGQLLRSAAQAAPGDLLRARLADGELSLEVKAVQKAPDLPPV